MKKVLIVANQYPPAGGSGVQRTAKFVKYLRLFGYEPIVFTKTKKNSEILDYSLLKEIPKDIKVIRSKALDTTLYKGIFKYPGKYFGRKLLIPDAEKLWQLFGRKKATYLMLNENIPLVYTTSYPYSDHLMGLYLKKHFPKIKWIADFRDEWTNNPYLLDNPYSNFRMKKEKRMEKDVLIKADVLITNTPVMLDNFLKNNKDLDLKNKFNVIPNGYDSTDFENTDNYTPPKNEKFTMTYTGALYGRRKPDYFFEALKNLLDNGKINRKKITVNLIGHYKEKLLYDKIKEYDLLGVVNIIKYLPHNECIKKLISSDALLLIEGEGKGSDAFYTGKVFEYMISKRPIIAMIPENGAAAQLIRKTKAGHISGCCDIINAEKQIMTLYNVWEKYGLINFYPDMNEIQKYERKAITKKLASLFDTMI